MARSEWRSPYTRRRQLKGSSKKTIEPTQSPEAVKKAAEELKKKQKGD